MVPPACPRSRLLRSLTGNKVSRIGRFPGISIMSGCNLTDDLIIVHFSLLSQVNQLSETESLGALDSQVRLGDRATGLILRE